LSDSRNPGPGGPDRVPSYGHQFGALHDRVVGDESPDVTFYTKVSNRQKVDYICKALRMAPQSFNLDLPLPLEDWALGEDMSLINSGLYFADLRRQFYGRQLRDQPELEQSPAWEAHADSEFWNHEFNRVLAKRSRGELINDGRVLN